MNNGARPQVYLYAARCVAARKSRGRWTVDVGSSPERDVDAEMERTTRDHPAAGRNAEISKRSTVRYVTCGGSRDAHVYCRIMHIIMQIAVSPLLTLVHSWK